MWDREGGRGTELSEDGCGRCQFLTIPFKVRKCAGIVDEQGICREIVGQERQRGICARTSRILLIKYVHFFKIKLRSYI